MKKKVLFIDKSFTMGGIQTSLLNLLECVSQDYDIDLFMYYPEGPLKNRVPTGVKVLEPSWMMESLGMTLRQCMKNGSLKQKVFRLLATGWTKVFSNEFPINIAIRHQKFLGEYDAVVAYHHEVGRKTVTAGFINVALGCAKGKKTISWIHNDSASYQIKKDEQYNEKWYQKVDSIVAVSKSVQESFASVHPTLADKTTYLGNFLGAKKIIEKSSEAPNLSFSGDSFNCFSASRLVQIKGIERAISSIADTLKSNGKIRWYIAGDGPNRESIKKAIADNGVEDYVVLLGQVENPYPYMRAADVLMVTSFFEAAPMVYSEAKIIGTPVFTTKLSSTTEMLTEDNTAYVCENSEDGIREGFFQLSVKMDEIRKKKKTSSQITMVGDKEKLERILFNGVNQ